MGKKRWYIDTEFLDDGKTLELISIGVVSELDAFKQSREYYATSADFDSRKLTPWLTKNVWPHVHPPHERKSRATIAAELKSLFLVPGPSELPEFWGYFADYDWVLFCQLFGAMIDLPKGFPQFCLDLKQDMYRLGIKREDLPRQEGVAHDALEDARWMRDVHPLILKRDR
jgi:hypothetical protein